MKKYCIVCNIVRTKCKQFHTKILVVKILDNPSVRSSECSPLRACLRSSHGIPPPEAARLINQSLRDRDHLSDSQRILFFGDSPGSRRLHDPYETSRARGTCARTSRRGASPANTII